MSWGAISVFAPVMASGTTLTAEIDLGRAWQRAWIDTTGAASEVRFQVATVSGGTYRQVMLPAANTSTVQANIWKISSGASGSLIDAPTGVRFLKVETTASVANGLTFKVICSS